MITSPQNTCISCFTQHAVFIDPCPLCGYNEAAQDIPPHVLRPRTILNGKYLIGKALGQGGFGITYIGWDLNLDIKVAVKEYYPTGFVTREMTSVSAATVQPFTGSQGEYFIKGRDKFIEEAKAMAKFFSLPGIVTIKDYFRENGTAYISMEFIDGQELKDHVIQMGGKLPAPQLFELIKPVIYSLAEVHKTGMIHRDISPDNIMISKEGFLKLLDFGAAKDFSESGNKSMSVMLKMGYAPEEQYRTRGIQGPWTDIYALSATIYRCITGVTPEESVERIRVDSLKPPSALGVSIDPALEAALMRGMAVFQEDRYQNVTELYNAFYGTQTGVSVAVPSHVIATPVASVVDIKSAAPTGSETHPEQDQTPESELSDDSVQNTKNPKRMPKQKWIVAIACGAVALIVLLTWNLWGPINQDLKTPEQSPDTPPSPDTTLSPQEAEIVGDWVVYVAFEAIHDDTIIYELIFNKDDSYFFSAKINSTDEELFVFGGVVSYDSGLWFYPSWNEQTSLATELLPVEFITWLNNYGVFEATWVKDTLEINILSKELVFSKKEP